MSSPVSISGKTSFSPGRGAPVVDLPFGAALQYDSKADDELVLTGSGTRALDLGTVSSAGLKLLIIELDAASPTQGGTPEPIFVRLNGAGATGQEEIAPGGGKALWSPNPVAGITAVTIVYSADVRVRYRAFS